MRNGSLKAGTIRFSLPDAAFGEYGQNHRYVAGLGHERECYFSCIEEEPVLDSMRLWACCWRCMGCRR